MKTIEHIQLLYEIATSIKNEIDLKKTIKIGLSAYLRKLNCSHGAVVWFNPDEETPGELSKIISIPRHIESVAPYQKAIDLLSSALKGQDFHFDELIFEHLSSGEYFYIMELPHLGYIILIKSGEALSPNIIKSLKRINIMLADAGIACVQKDELEKHKTRLEEIVKQQTEKLVNKNIDLVANIKKEIELKKELHLAHENLNTILNTSLVGIVIISKDLEILWINNYGKTLLGYDSTETIVGSTCKDYFCSKCSSTCPIIDEENKIQNEEYFIKQKNNSEIPVLRTIKKIKWSNEEVFLKTFIDISKLKKMEAELVEARKLESIGQLAAGIAHEINTPAQYVGDNIQFLKDSFQDLMKLFNIFGKMKKEKPESNGPLNLLDEAISISNNIDIEYILKEIPDALEQSNDGLKKISAIVKAMKEFSHPGKKEKSLIDINRAINNTIMVCRNEWKYDAELETDLDPNLGMVSCLVNEFNQVILNIIINASHAIAEKRQGKGDLGKIYITTKSVNGMAQIKISDTGYGIPKEIEKRIFDPFFTTKEVGKGTGQGLAIARDIIINKHSGTIRFETAENKGTTFIIELPIG